MKKLLKKAATVLMAALVLAGAYAPVVKAEATKVVVHVQDGEGWGNMNVYDWGDDGELAGVWPGTAMTAEADNWYTYTFETGVDLNLVFCASAGTPQSGNVEAVSKDVGEIWVVIGGEGEANDMGAATIQTLLFTEAEEGWPSAAADVEETAETTDVPKTGEDTPVLAIALIGLAALSAAVVVILKKKEKIFEN